MDARAIKKYTKNFDAWNEIKCLIHVKNTERILIQQGAIWLMNVGVNVGSEVDGKGTDFARPVIVIRRINDSTFYGIPVSSKIVEDFYRIRFKMLREDRIALFSQMRSFDKKRCIRLITILPLDIVELFLIHIQILFTSRNPSSTEMNEGNLDCPKGDSESTISK